ncbi:MAG: tRNA pseudouridine(38-40) synthase TruA [Aquisalimonadaceae bacterium]
MRLAMGVEYDGRAYAGWQFQRHAPSVQATLERALGRVANMPVSVTCAGRTDAGVHALGQVINFDTTAQRPLRGWLLGVTSQLPDDIAVTWVREVSAEFSARFTATGRSYRYIILPRVTRPGLLNGRVAWTHRTLDAARMDEAAQVLVGEHDFSAFRAIGCQARHPWREITRISVSRHGPYIHLDVSANAFLHHMVRNIAGVLMAIGAGEQPVDWARQVLDGRDRTLGGVTAPAQGLYLVAVDYPETFELPASPPPPAFS